MADLAELENADAVRLTWNIWPHNRVEATKCVIPFAALYTPNKTLENMPVVQYDPVPCKGCGAILNPLALVDYATGVWTCCLCHARNNFPAGYQGISQENQPAELFPQYQTIEYQTASPKVISPPAYVFVIDTCVAEDELSACRAALTKALQTLPEYTQVGLITFGTHVHVHELGFSECSKSYVFQGTREYTPQQVVDQLGLGKSRQTQQQQQMQHPGRRFIPQLGDCEFTITAVLDELQRDAFPPVADHRPNRCTGTALQVAAGLMHGALTGVFCAARLMLFVGGPSTCGGGMIVNTELSEAIRSHKDLVKEAAPHYKKAKKYFDGIAKQLVSQGHALDIFACSLDQVGLSEMKVPVEATGGLVVQTDTFHNPVFKESMKRVFARHDDPTNLGLASNATFEVIPSRVDGEVKVSGILGRAAPIEKKGPAVGDQVIGMGGTTQWKLASLDAATTLAIFFEVGGSKKDKAIESPNFFLQFITRYLHAEGTLRTRVTTITRSWTDGANVQDLTMGFDQEAAAVIIARLASHKMETEEEFDATRWLDRTLIRLTSRFGHYRKEDADSFELAHQMSFFPQFIFNLRRSPFVQVFGNSPDETAYCRLVLNKEPAAEALLAIQPTLMAHSLDAPLTPVLLDVSSIQPNVILVLDSYFYVVVFHGSTIAQWRKQRFQDQAEYASFKQLLEEGDFNYQRQKHMDLQAPQKEAMDIVHRRFPVPRLVDCDQNGSQARFLTAKLNPSATHSTASQMGAGSEIIFTDDVSLDVFTEHLKKLAVQG